jgi:hypothetical protein
VPQSTDIGATGKDLYQPATIPRVRLQPRTDDSLVVRTDYSDAAAWKVVCDAITRPVGDFRAYFEFMSDPSFEGAAPGDLLDALPHDVYRSVLFVIDSETLRNPDHPVLVLDLHAEPGRMFRVVPQEMWAVENNLSLGNMDFKEFADAVGQDGVFRGFPT